MGAYVEALLSRCANGGIEQQHQSLYVVQTTAGVLYNVYIDENSDVAFRKSTDGGKSWGAATVVFAGTATALAVWYDRWSGIAAGQIHCAYIESGTDDTLYRCIDTENSDTLSTQTVIFAGATTATGGQVTIARARGGNVYCRTCIDAGAEGGFFRLPNANVPNGAWDAARTINEALATTDQMILVPGWAADNQDMMLFFMDASADGLSRQLYDDSANSWSESAIIADGGIAELAPTTAISNFAAAVDLANSRNIVVAWTATDAANADLRCFTVTESAITETSANVVLNSTDDQGLCAIGIDTLTGHWYVFYLGASAGGDTWNTLIGVYYKVSTDGGATWSAERAASLINSKQNRSQLYCTPRFAGNFSLTSMVGGSAMLTTINPYFFPQSAAMAGGMAA